jgi:hypothetical protein
MLITVGSNLEKAQVPSFKLQVFFLKLAACVLKLINTLNIYTFTKTNHIFINRTEINNDIPKSKTD